MSRLPRTSACRGTLPWGATILAVLSLAAWAVAPLAAQTRGAVSFSELPPDFQHGGELPPVPPPGPLKITVGPLTFYTDGTLFDSDFPGLPLEDFEESPVPPFGILGCNEPIDGSSNDDCFNPGEIIPGIAVGTFEGGHSGCPSDCPMVTLGDGLLGQADIVAGPNFFADTLLLTMTEDACAVGLFSHGTVAETLDVTVTTQSGVFPTTVATSPPGLFWGVATLGDPIVSIRFASPTGGGELLDNVRLGVDTCSIADVTATKVDLPGTPAMPGDAITYQVDISNAGPDPAVGVEFDDTPDSNTTLSGGVTTTPLALDDGLYEGDPTTPTMVDGTLQPLLLANDFGIPGTPTLAALPVVGQPTTLGGSVDVNADGSFTYTPPPGATGGEVDTFTYDIQNGIPPSSPATDTATASILLGLAPVAQDDLLAVVQNTMTVLDAAADNGSGADDFGVPAGAVDLYGPVGGPLTTVPGSALALASGNTVNFDVSGDGTFTYDATVNPTFSGAETFEYQVTNSVGSDTAVVTIEVQAPPVAVDDAPSMLSVPGDPFHTPLDTALDSSAHATPSVLANDDLGFPLAVVVSYGTSASPTDQTVPGASTATDNGGTVVVAADGNFVYTPPSPTFTGPDMFGYRIQNAVGFDDGVVTIAVGLRPACDDEVDPDDYDALGNVQITVPDTSGVLIGDTGDEISVTGNTAPASGGVASVAPDGSFTYTSGPGYTGDDTFTYTMGNGFPGGATCTVAVTVVNTIWFIDNEAASGGNGTQGAPYDSFTAYATPALDDAGDIIFIDEGDGTTTDYDTGIVLKNNQRLIGQGVDLTTAAGLTLPPFSDSLPGVATRPLIKNTGGAGVTLANGNLVTGFDVSGASGASIAATNSVGVTIDDVGLAASGGDGLAFTNVTGIIDVNNLDVSAGSTLGVNITSGSATYDFDSSSSITSPTGAAFQISGGTASVTYSGSITQSNNATTVSVANHASGTVIFQTGTISAVNGNGLQFSNADGTYGFNGTTTLSGGDAGIDILGGSAGSFTFAGTAVTNPSGTGLNIDTSTAAVTWSGGSGLSKNNAGAAVAVNAHSVGAVNIGVVVTATNGTGLQFNDADGAYNFNTMTGATVLNGGDAGIDILTGSSGTFTFGNATITSPTNGSFNLDASSANVDYTGGSITQASAATAYRANGNTGGTQNIGVPITANTSTAAGISLTGNSGATINFTGALDIDTTSGGGFVATGGGTVTNDAADANTVDTTAAGVGVNVTSTTIGAGGLTFRRVSSFGATNGIILDNSGSGPFTITGDGSTATQGGNDSGGIIRNTTGDGVVLTTAQNVTLANMTIGDPAATPADTADAFNVIAGDGIQATGVTNLTLNNMTIARTGAHGVNAVSSGGAPSLTDFSINDSWILNAGDGNEEHALNLDELRGDNFVRRSLFDAFNETGLELMNQSGTVDLTVDNSTFQDNLFTPGNFGEEAILIEAQGSAQIVFLVANGSLFDDINRQGVQAISLGTTSDIELTVRDSSFLHTQTGSAIIIMNPDNAGNGNVTVKDNIFSDNVGPFAVLAKNDSSGTLDVTVQGNTVTNMQLLNVNHDDIGSGGGANGTTRVLVGGATAALGNTVNVGTNNIAIDVIATESGPVGSGPDLSLTITNNVTSQPDGNFTYTPGLRMETGNECRLNANISANSFQGDPSAAGGSGIEVREFDASVFGLEGFAGGNEAAAQTFIDTANPLSVDVSFVTSWNSNISSGAATLPTPTTLPSP